MRPCSIFVRFLLCILMCSSSAVAQDEYQKLRKSWEEFFEKRANPSALEDTDEEEETDAESLILAQSTTNQFSSPEEIISQNGELNTTLVVDYSYHQIGNDPVHLRTYNQKLVGPTLRAKPGDKLRVRLINRLPTEPAHSGSHNSHHEWNTTNLHTHGLHVSPSGKADNVFRRISPKTSFDYEIDIPEDHPAGTFWYHAHKHGAVSAQVASGMSGAIIIDGDLKHEDAWVRGLDEIDEIRDAKEQVMIFQQIPYVILGGFGRVELASLSQMFGPTAWDTLGRHTTVNGVQLPTIRMRPGEIQRWRMVHSGFRESLKLKLMRDPDTVEGPAGIEFNEIAVDGLALHKMMAQPHIEMWPGYRSDVLVKAPASGSYLLVDERTGVVNSMNGLSESRKFVAKVVVEGQPLAMELPAEGSINKYRLPSISADDVSGLQTVTYGINAPPLQFAVDGHEYDSNNVRRLELGKTEEWTAKSENNVGPIHHPFHIHVNPFEIFSIKNESEVEQLDHPIWRDTVILRAGWTVKFRTHYKRFTGKFVHHCHILDHEDQGMMESVEIFDPNATSALELSEPALADLDARILGKRSVLNFFVGTSCSHCNTQLAELSQLTEEFNKRGINLVCISSNEESHLDYPFDVISDPEHKLFRKYGCYENEPKHGTLLISQHGKPSWKVTGDAPFSDFEVLLETIDNQGTIALTSHESALEAAEDGDSGGETATDDTLLRKDIDELTDEELENFKYAFKKLKEDRPGVFARHVSLHNGSAGPCEHGNDLFLPWHRAHLYFFEQDLRAIDPPRTANVRLPYWNWTKAPSGDRYPEAYEDASSSLFHAIRRNSGSELPTEDEIKEILDNGDWEEFGGGTPGFGELEAQPHNHMHGDFISGSMGNPSSAAEDPIYWAFHCYLDLLWDRWQKKHGKSPSSLTAVLRGMPNGMKVEDVINVESQLGYTYMKDEEIDLAIGEIEAGALESDDTSRIFSMDLDIPELKSSQSPRLYFAAVKVPSNRSYRADLYLHPKSVAFRNDDSFEKYKFDYFVMWRTHNVAGEKSHHPASAPVRLRGIAKAIEKMTENQKSEDWQVTVVCKPTGVPSAFESDEEIDVDFGQAKLILKE